MTKCRIYFNSTVCSLLPCRNRRNRRNVHVPTQDRRENVYGPFPAKQLVEAHNAGFINDRKILVKEARMRGEFRPMGKAGAAHSGKAQASRTPSPAHADAGVLYGHVLAPGTRKSRQRRPCRDCIDNCLFIFTSLSAQGPVRSSRSCPVEVDSVCVSLVVMTRRACFMLI